MREDFYNFNNCCTDISSGLEDSTICFCYAQLASIIEQLIILYSGNTFTVYTNTWFTVTGVPYSLYTSPDATGPALFILTDGGYTEVLISAITAIDIGAGTVYNPDIKYLTPVLPFPKGCDKNIITAIHDNLPVSLDEISIYLPILTHASGAVYKNEYGIIVLSDEFGNTPIFIPSYKIAIVETSVLDETKKISNQVITEKSKVYIETKQPWNDVI